MANDTKLDDFLNPKRCPLFGKYRELAGAIKSLASADGEAFVGSGFITPPCAVAVCYAFRECLFFYVYVTFLELRRAESYVHLVDTFFDWPVTVCRACSLVLIVGFLPERGLFDASTGILFWVLLEAGTLRH